MTPEQLAATPQAAFDREFGLRGSFHDFVVRAWPQVESDPFVDGWHIRLVCNVLERVRRREIRKLVINEPPATMKSLLVSVFWPVWCWIRDPSERFLGTSFDIDLTRRDASKSLALVQSEWFQQRWGDVVWVDEGAGVGSHKNSAGGWRFATSTGSKATGWHPTIKIIDDPTKPQDASPNKLEEAKRYWNNTLRTRQKDPKTSCTVLIMQRLAVNDLAGVFWQEGDWHFVVLPMRYAPGPRAYPDDPRRTKGELLWPERYGEPEVKELEKMPLRDRSAQLDQDPVPEGGNIIKDHWIKWYDPADTGKIVVAGVVLPGPPKRWGQKVASWDLTFKGTEEAHYVAGQVWGVDGVDRYFIDGVLDRMDFVESVRAVVRYVDAHPGAGVLVEDKANGPAVMSVLEGKVNGLVAVEPLGGKAARLNAASPQFEGGNVFLPYGHPVAELLAKHLVQFPVGETDDDVDACTQALNYLQENSLDYAALVKRYPRGF